jgi:RNA polymerase sigma-70 factor (ECF subfamily)
MDIETIYQAHAQRVYAFFYVKSFDKMTAEDLTSKVFMIMVEKTADPEVVVNDVSAYLSGIMRNVWLRHLQEKYQNLVDSVEEIDDFSGFVKKTVDEAETEGLEKIAEPYINRLPEKQQIILRMRLLEKQTLKEICQSLDKDMNYVRTTQKRGIAKLKELLADETLQLTREEAS